MTDTLWESSSGPGLLSHDVRPCQCKLVSTNSTLVIISHKFNSPHPAMAYPTYIASPLGSAVRIDRGHMIPNRQWPRVCSQAWIGPLPCGIHQHTLLSSACFPWMDPQSELTFQNRDPFIADAAYTPHFQFGMDPQARYMLGPHSPSSWNYLI